MAIEAGLFIMMNVVSVILLIVNVRFKEYFLFVPTFLFLVLGMWLMQGEVFVFQTNTFDGVTWINSTEYLIGSPDVSYSEYSPWLGLAYVISAIILAFVALLGLSDPQTKKSF